MPSPPSLLVFGMRRLLRAAACAPTFTPPSTTTSAFLAPHRPRPSTLSSLRSFHAPAALHSRFPALYVSPSRRREEQLAKRETVLANRILKRKAKMAERKLKQSGRKAAKKSAKPSATETPKQILHMRRRRNESGIRAMQASSAIDFPASLKVSPPPPMKIRPFLATADNKFPEPIVPFDLAANLAKAKELNLSAERTAASAAGQGARASIRGMRTDLADTKTAKSTSETRLKLPSSLENDAHTQAAAWKVDAIPTVPIPPELLPPKSKKASKLSVPTVSAGPPLALGLTAPDASFLFHSAPLALKGMVLMGVESNPNQIQRPMEDATARDASDRAPEDVEEQTEMLRRIVSLENSGMKGIRKYNRLRLVELFGRRVFDTGSPEVQAALFTEKIESIRSHLSKFPKDMSTKRVLQATISKRTSILKYLRRKGRLRVIAVLAVLLLSIVGFLELFTLSGGRSDRAASLADLAEEALAAKEPGRDAAESPVADKDEAIEVEVGPVKVPVKSEVKPEASREDREKLDAIREMMLHAWNGYKTYAWGADEVRPVSGQPLNWYTPHSLLSTPVDALDTLHLMNLTAEYEAAKELVLTKLDMAKVDEKINLFETTIRVVGGLLGAYEMDPDERYIAKARECLELFWPAFETPTGMPLNYINVVRKKAEDHSHGTGTVLLSEVGTIQLEWQYMSDITGDDRYAKKALFVYEQLRSMNWPIKGLYKKRFNPSTLEASKYGAYEYGVGGETDSFYEYMLKTHISTGDPRYLEMYEETVGAMEKHMIIKGADDHLFIPDAVQNTGIANFHYESFFPHLGCYLGGLFSTSAKYVKKLSPARMMELGAAITDTCFQSYEHTKSGLGPETFNTATFAPHHSYYILRPEYVESLFYMWRYTHDEKYRERGWKVAIALNTTCRAAAGFHSLENVDHMSKRDRMESFFFAETLKYLYLLFSNDDVIPLDKYVFNTEAHPLSIRGHGRRASKSHKRPLPKSAADFGQKPGTLRKIDDS
ncbi:hypothetical protein HDU96_010055 [Phlyctochytrium bullatum]|nr:hypothetical protein HDU96_010055 [Phlyctochytrium bullatum]